MVATVESVEVKQEELAIDDGFSFDNVQETVEAKHAAPPKKPAPEVKKEEVKIILKRQPTRINCQV